MEKKLAAEKALQRKGLRVKEFDREEARDKSIVVLQNNIENTIDGECYQREGLQKIERKQYFESERESRNFQDIKKSKYGMRNLTLTEQKGILRIGCFCLAT